MKNTINLLIQTLKAIDEDASVESHNGMCDISHPLVIAVKYLANTYLIGDDGHPIGKEMDRVRESGYPIYPGETDRFGWLTGLIEIKNGSIIVFG